MSNPTSNFNWQMPTNTDLVTDLPADFEVFGQAVDTSLADLKGGTTGQILSKASATDMDFTWIANDQGDITGVTASSPLTGGGTSGAITVGIQDALTTQKGAVQLSDSTSTTSSILAATPTAVKSAYDLAAAAVPKSTVTTAGDVIYATGSGAVTRLGIGTAGQVLKVNSGATAPEWGTASGGGKVLQVVSVTKSDSFTAAAGVGNWSDVTGLSATITPTLATSKILMLYNVSASQQVGFNVCHSQVLRGATVINLGDAAGSRVRSTSDPISAAGALIGTTIAGSFLDSPATTSATTYKWQVMANGGTVYVNRSETDGNSVDYARTVSTITLMEIGA